MPKRYNANKVIHAVRSIRGRLMHYTICGHALNAAYARYSVPYDEWLNKIPPDRRCHSCQRLDVEIPTDRVNQYV